MSWFDRWPHYCITVADNSDLPAVMAAFGATLPVPPPDSFRTAVTAISSGPHPVLFEDSTYEGHRDEVLCRLSAHGRALSYTQTGDGMSFIAYAEAGRVLASFEPFFQDSDAGLTLVAEKVGLATEHLHPDGSNRELAFRLMHAGFGVAIDAGFLQGPGVKAGILPVLPHVPDQPHLSALRDWPELSCVIRLAPPERVAEAVSLVAAQAAETAGLTGHPLLKDFSPRPITNESDLGVLLRTLMADGDVYESPPEVALRGQAARILFTALASAPTAAAPLLASFTAPVAAGRLILAALADIEVPQEMLQAAREKAAQARAGLGRSLGVLIPDPLPPGP